MTEFPYTPEQLAWLEALESGAYQQAREKLVTPDGRYCCLGVACKMYEGALDIEGWPDRIDQDAPDPIVDLLKLRDSCGISFDAELALVELNDDGKTFAEIAAIIRANPSEYFRNLDGADDV